MVRDFAEFLFGLRARRPRAVRRLGRIRERVYTEVAALEATISRSDEPVRFEDLDPASFVPLRPGTAWGRKMDCAWIHLTGSVPDGVVDPVVLLGIRGEGLVVDRTGTILDSVSTVFLQGDLPHSGGRFRPVHGVDLADGAIDLYADVAYNGFLLYDVGRAVYHGAMLATRDESAFALYYDYLTLLALADATEDAALAEALLAALRTADARVDADDMDGARSLLAPHLAATTTSGFTYDAVGHGHLDMAWLWPIRETRRKAARTYAKQLANLRHEPDFVYGTSQPQQLAWVKAEHPELYERVRAQVAAGRIELQGAFWVEPDTNLPSGESLVRQALVGRRFLEEEFGVGPDDLRVCWLPDTFGYSGNLPQILRGAGMDRFLTIKLAWNKVNDFPHRTFHWEGIDGSSVLVHMPPEGDYNSRAAADNLLNGIARYPERDLGSALLVYGAGDGGGGPGEVHLELLRRERDLRGLPRVVYSRADAFFDRLAERDIPHTHRGELYLETHQGTYTTQGRIKRLNRMSERRLHDAEALAVLTDSDIRSELAPIWRDVLLNQFHDIIPGSSIERVNREAVETYERRGAELDGLIADLAARLPGSPGARSVINLTSFPRSEHVSVDGVWKHVDVAPYAAARPTDPLPADGLRSEGDTLSNGIVTIRFEQDGSIVSLLDAAGEEHAREGLNRLVLHDDPYQFPFDAWDIRQDYHRRPPRRLEATRVETFVDGPMAVRRQLYRFSKSRVEQRVVLEAGSGVVRFETIVDWQEKHKMLRAEFRPVADAPTARSEIQFGHIERVTTERDQIETAQFEVCAHRWVAIEDDVRGFALLNDGKYGHRIKGGLMSLNLLRAPTFPDPTADRGIHRFTYEVMAFAPGDIGPVIAEGYRLNNPLVVADVDPFASVVATSDGGVVVETVKAAESGRGTIVRLYESLGRHADVVLSTSIPHGRAVRTDLLERPIGAVDLGALSVGPFEIVTLLLEDG